MIGSTPFDNIDDGSPHPSLRGLDYVTPVPEVDVGPRPSSWWRSHPSRLASARDDFGFPLVILRVQDFVRDARALEHARQRLRHVDAHGSDEHRESERVQALRLLENRVVLLAPRLVDEVLPVFADDRPVGRDNETPSL